MSLNLCQRLVHNAYSRAVYYYLYKLSSMIVRVSVTVVLKRTVGDSD